MLHALFRGFVYSNFWVGLSVASLTTISFIQRQDWNSDYILLCFFSTVAFYGYARWVETKDLNLRPEQHIAAWTTHNRVFLTGLFIASTGAAAFYWFGLSTQGKWLFAGAAVISSFYTIPSVFDRKGVRYLAGVKLVYIALVWTLVTLTIPAVLAEEHYSTGLLIQHIERFAFILALTIPFDIRDAKTDSTELLTLPMWIGISGARNVALSAIALVIILQLYPGYHPGPFPYGILFIYLLCGYLIHRSDRDMPDMFFSFFLEGIPVLIAIWTIFKTFVLSSI